MLLSFQPWIILKASRLCIRMLFLIYFCLWFGSVCRVWLKMHEWAQNQLCLQFAVHVVAQCSQSAEPLLAGEENEHVLFTEAYPTHWLDFFNTIRSTVLKKKTELKASLFTKATHFSTFWSSVSEIWRILISCTRHVTHKPLASHCTVVVSQNELWFMSCLLLWAAIT